MLRSSKRYRQRLSGLHTLSTPSSNSIIMARLNIRPTNIATSAAINPTASTMRGYATASSASRAALAQKKLPTPTTRSPRYSRLRTPTTSALPKPPPLPPHLSKLFNPPSYSNSNSKSKKSQIPDDPLLSLPLGLPRREYSDYLEAMEIWEEMERIKGREKGRGLKTSRAGATGSTSNQIDAGAAVQSIEPVRGGDVHAQEKQGEMDTGVIGKGRKRSRLPSIADLRTFTRRSEQVQGEDELLGDGLVLAGRKKKEVGGEGEEGEGDKGKVKKVDGKRGAKVKPTAADPPINTPPHPFPPSSPITSSPSPLRRNPAGVQLLSPSLHSQIFPSRPPSPPPQSVINISLAHLADNDLSPNGAAVLPEINFELPELRGGNVREHFWRVGEEVAEPWLGMARDFAGMGRAGEGEAVDVEVPELPKEWVVDQPGWVKYPKGGGAGSWERVKDLGGEGGGMICFDVEVLYKISPYPVMATAATKDAWYSWLSPSIFADAPPAGELVTAGKDKNQARADIPSTLIPLTLSKPTHPSLIIGHNVGYDRSKVFDEYHLSLSNNRWLDTLSLHVATKGITSVQRPKWMKRRKEKTQLMEMEMEGQSLVREMEKRTGGGGSQEEMDEVLASLTTLTEESKGEGVGGGEGKTWEDVTSSNSLAEVYRLHYGGKVDKSVRSEFANPNITSATQLRGDLQRLLTYCGTDVAITHKVFKKTLPLFLLSCPHPASFAGALGMGNPFLPIDKSWKEYLENAEGTYRRLEGGVKSVLWELAYRLKERGHVPGDPWSEQLDWTMKAARWDDETFRRGVKAAAESAVSSGVSASGEAVEGGEVEKEDIATAPVVTPEEEQPRSAEKAETMSSQVRNGVSDKLDPPTWVVAAEKWIKHTPTSYAKAGDVVPLILQVKLEGYPLLESLEHRWVVQVPKAESAAFKAKEYDGPLAFTAKDRTLVDEAESFVYFKPVKKGQAKMTSPFTKKAQALWKAGILTSSYPDLAYYLSQGDSREFRKEEIEEALAKFVAKGKETAWGRALDWSPRILGSKADVPLTMAEKQDAIKARIKGKKEGKIPGMWPKWFWELTPTPGKGLPAGELDLTVRKKVAPLLLRMQWNGFPLFHSRKHGWLYLIPESATKAIQAVEPVLPGDVQLPSSMPPGVFAKLPHAQGSENNVGNPLSKSFMRYIESGTLSSGQVAGVTGDDGIASAAKDAMDMNAQCSYWMSARERILEQLAVYAKDLGTIGLDPEREHENNLGMILPQVITMGTVTRRAVESTWLTASNAKKNRVGSELKAMVRAPPGYAIVGADVDSEELWIASVMGDSQFGMHGSSAIGWMTLEGTKSAGTDLHSKTAKILKTSRDNAKVFNYSRIYGAGIAHAVQLLLQNDPTLSHARATELAQDLYTATKGSKTHRSRKKSEPQSNAAKYLWHGGSESFLFNALEAIAYHPLPKTPALGCGVTDALKRKYLPQDDSKGATYLPSRINWVVQSSGVDYLHLLIVAMDHLCRRYGIQARYMLSVHDELRYLVKEEDKYRAALAMQIANIWTRALICYNLGIHDLPQGVAFFSAVDIDHILRKEVDMPCVTPSQPIPLAKGESVDIMQLLEKTGGKLGDVVDDSSFDGGRVAAQVRAAELPTIPSVSAPGHLLHLQAQASRMPDKAREWLRDQNLGERPKPRYNRADVYEADHFPKIDHDELHDVVSKHRETFDPNSPPVKSKRIPSPPLGQTTRPRSAPLRTARVQHAHYSTLGRPGAFSIAETEEERYARLQEVWDKARHYPGRHVLGHLASALPRRSRHIQPPTAAPLESCASPTSPPKRKRVFVEGKHWEMVRNLPKAQVKPGDYLSQMLSAPVRRCIATGARLPKDYLIAVRTALTPSLSPTIPSARDSEIVNNASPNERSLAPVHQLGSQVKPAIYVVPDRILRGQAKLKGQCKWVLCNVEALRSLGKRAKVFKHGKSFASLSKALGAYVLHQLQTRIVQELEALVIGLQRVRRASAIARVPPLAALSVAGELDDAVKLTPRAFDGCAAILDTADMAPDNAAIEGSATHDLLASGLQVQQLRLPTTSSDETGISIPVYRLSDALPLQMHKQARDHLEFILGCRAEVKQQDTTATEGTRSSTRDNSLRYIAIYADPNRPWAIPLLVALKRVHLWSGSGCERIP